MSGAMLWLRARFKRVWVTLRILSEILTFIIIILVIILLYSASLVNSWIAEKAIHH